MWMRVLIALCGLLLLPPAVHAAEVTIAKPPAWVNQQAFEVPTQVPDNEVVDGLYYLLIDRQTRVAQGEVHRFYHVAKQILTTEGAENASQLFISFDPSYQTLQMHFVKIHKADRVIDELQANRIKLFQREDELDRRMYNGQKTANLILEGTGAGDIIEYAYTIVGHNPVFGERFVHHADLSWDVPLLHLYSRYLFGGGQPIHYRNHNTAWQPAVHRSAQGIEYLYDQREVAAVISDGDLPAWYTPYAWLEFSRFDDWADVAAWGTRLYQRPTALSAALQKKIQTLRQQPGTMEDRIAAALCAVQSDIRYLGIEIGEGSYKPSDPSLTFKRKFGDCKDKTMLFCTLLNELGVTAWPALVHTNRRHKIDDLLPSPLAFNHVITKITWQGKTYWVDPTGDCQQVPLAEQYPASYGSALVLAPDTRGLEPIAEQRTAEPEKEIIETFDLTDGVGQAARLTIATTYRGREADYMRYEVKSSGIQQTAKSYLNYYASDYPSIEARKPMAIEDDMAANRYTINEFYTIPHFWRTSEQPGETSGTFYAREIEALFKKPRTTIRTMPIGLSHPTHVRQSTIVQLPEPWQVTPGHFQVDNDAFSFLYDVVYADRVLKLLYNYRTKADFVPAAQAGQYIAELDRINDEIGYIIYTQEENKAIAGFAIGACIAGLLLALGCTLAMYRFDPAPPSVATDYQSNRNLSGIGGWLTLVAFGLLIRPFVHIAGLLAYRPYLTQNNWDALADLLLPTWVSVGKWAVAGEIALNATLLTASLMLLVLFFQKRSSFPYLFILLGVGAILIDIGDTLLWDTMLRQGATRDLADAGASARNGFSVILWSIYMIKSVRVKNTFRKRRRRQPHQETLNTEILPYARA